MTLSLWNKKNIQIFILGIILILALFLRIYKLSLVPPELFGDELDVGYQAYSILQTGRDLQGNFLPTYIQSLAEWRAPLFLYSAVPFVAIFGLNEWGVRLAASFWGILGILAIYFLTQKLSQNSSIAVIAALLLAISPWHLQYSRAGFEVTLLIFLLILATFFFLLAIDKPNLFIFSSILFALIPYTYSTGALFIPLFVLALLIIFREKIIKLVKDRWFKIAIIVFILILLPFAWQLLFGQAGDRFQTIGIALNPAIEKNINEARFIDKGGGFFFHNKPLVILFEISRNYFWVFSPQFLFIDGDPNLRHSIGQMGEFYWFFLPLFLIGIYSILKNDKFLPQTRAILFSWLLLAPLPASLTYFGTGHATRLFLLLPPLIIMAAIGASEILQNFLRSRLKILLVIIIVIVAVVNLTTYFHRYYVHYPVESWRWWQIGYKQAFAYIKDNQDQYDSVVINNTYEPALIRFLFYMEFDPSNFHQKFIGDKHNPNILPGIDGFVLDKYYFGTLSAETKGANELAKVLNHKMLYLASQRDEIVGDLDLRKNSPKEIKVLKTITNPFGEPIFYLLTGNTE